MSYAGADQAADVLAALRLRPRGTRAINDLPAEIRPPGLVEAYDVQARLRHLLAVQSPGAPCGWKIGCTTPVMQGYLKIPHPCAGTLYSNWTQTGNLALVAADYLTLGLECEIAVELGRDLPLRDRLYERADLEAAVGAVMASIEVVEHRFRDFSRVTTASLVADDFFSAGCVTGPRITPEEAGDLALLRGGFSVDGARPEDIGTGAEILGHPLSALGWLADHVARLGTPLQAGQVITLGSVVKTIYPQPGQRIEARFTRLPGVWVEVI